MRYHFQRPHIEKPVYGKTYICDHPVYSCCTLYESGGKGLAVIQQRYDAKTKHTWWGALDEWITGEIYLNANFKRYFDERAGKCMNGVYPTVSVRQIMWALKMKPLRREKWETVFDRRNI